MPNFITLTYLRRFLAYGSVAILTALLTAYILFHQWRDDLKPWHLASLDAEFTARDAGRVRSFGDYLRVEEQVFSQLREEVYDQVPDSHRRLVNRYAGGSLADPTGYPRDWNRSFELAPANQPVGGVLLLHGMSDSPYSLHSIGEHLNRRGWQVLGLRLPGHGTAPAGLTRSTWQDSAAATRIGVRHLREQIGPDAPLFIVGYSNGAALAVEYVLAELAGEDIPRVNGLVLLSPAIGVSPAASLAVWQSRLARIPGLEKLAWNSLSPEYDPYKYTSFAVNAGDQVFQLTRLISQRLDGLARSGEISKLPPIMAVQSVADATVSVKALLTSLFLRLSPGGGHELLVFDINRDAEVDALLNLESIPDTVLLLGSGPYNFDLKVLRNASSETQDIVSAHLPAGDRTVSEDRTTLAWPPMIFSLSHVALPFAPDDPIYGHEAPVNAASIHLGSANLLGERGLLSIPAADLTRLRYNPFFEDMAGRIDAFLDLHGPHKITGH